MAGGAPGRRPPALAHRHSRRRAKAGVRPGLSGALGAKNVTGADPTVGFAHRAPARCSGAGSARRGDSGADTWQGPGHTGRCLSDPPRPRAHTEPQCAWGLRAQPSTDTGERLWALGPVADRSWFSKKIVRLLLFFKSGDLGGRTPERKPAGRERRTAGLAGWPRPGSAVAPRHAQSPGGWRRVPPQRDSLSAAPQELSALGPGGM